MKAVKLFFLLVITHNKGAVGGFRDREHQQGFEGSPFEIVVGEDAKPRAEWEGMASHRQNNLINTMLGFN